MSGIPAACTTISSMENENYPNSKNHMLAIPTTNLHIMSCYILDDRYQMLLFFSNRTSIMSQVIRVKNPSTEEKLIPNPTNLQINPY